VYTSVFTYTYDVASSTFPARARTKGRLSSVTEPNGQGSVAYWYDELGRTSLTARTISGVSAWEQTVFTASGLVFEQDAGDGFKLVPSYDRAGRLVSIKDGVGADVWRAGLGAAP